MTDILTIALICNTLAFFTLIVKSMVKRIKLPKYVKELQKRKQMENDYNSMILEDFSKS